MLNAIESRLAAIVGDGLSTRAHLSVVQAPAAIDDVAAAGVAVRVSITEWTPEPAFERGNLHLTTGENPTSRRALPLRFSAKLEFRARPATNSSAAELTARGLLLEDLSLAAHLLGAEDVRSGIAFATAVPDPGFRVRAFQVRGGSAAIQLAGDLLAAELTSEGQGLIWPPSVSRDEGTIAAVDTLLVMPVNVRVEPPAVPLGGTATLHVRSASGQRLTDTSGGRAPLALATRVVSDLPLARRGTVTSGSDGTETGVRIVVAEPLETSISYRAPASNVGTTRSEYVAVHLAKADGSLGPFLGSAAVQLRVEEA